jgi:hypothetical protein
VIHDDLGEITPVSLQWMRANRHKALSPPIAVPQRDARRRVGAVEVEDNGAWTPAMIHQLAEALDGTIPPSGGGRGLPQSSDSAPVDHARRFRSTIGSR